MLCGLQVLLKCFSLIFHLFRPLSENNTLHALFSVNWLMVLKTGLEGSLKTFMECGMKALETMNTYSTDFDLELENWTAGF